MSAEESAGTGPVELSPKEEVAELLRNIPDDVTLEDIAYHLDVLIKIKEGERDFAEGRYVSIEEAKVLAQQWLSGEKEIGTL
jgi:hypothetical protein